ncbi:MAG: anaerobic ribonucleoside-triphosphate reductase activating protein [Candidatus Bathyarchaeota archaeon]|jgi:pyruvate formate lyase activating enzyme|nr:anaerobic ribonucleoside-triphosphate reductase activating protein [Candidatus Bathyarchaeota archaeon]
MKLPKIKGFIDLSLVDWDGKTPAVIFLPKCNFRCPYCYNKTLVTQFRAMPTVPFGEIRKYLSRSKGILNGVVLTGGEPTIHGELPALCSEIKKLGLLVKLDTNGTNHMVVERLISRSLVDYVALDVKAPLDSGKYSKAVGVDMSELLAEVDSTIDALLGTSAPYELRTTLVPTLHTTQDVEDICNRVRGCKRLVLQNFKCGVETLDPRFSNISPFSEKEMGEFLKLARRIVPNTFWRRQL